jgi:hypothetical protein
MSGMFRSSFGARPLIARDKGLARLCHIAELPREISSRAIPGVSLQKRGAAGHLMSAGTPIPTHSQALPRFSTFAGFRVSTGSHCELVSRGIRECDKVELGIRGPARSISPVKPTCALKKTMLYGEHDIITLVSFYTLQRRSPGAARPRSGPTVSGNPRSAGRRLAASHGRQPSRTAFDAGKPPRAPSRGAAQEQARCGAVGGARASPT